MRGFSWFYFKTVMKNKLTLFTLLFSLCSLSAQVKPLPIQTAMIDSSIYVVELIPLKTAQKNVDAQLVQVNKQIETAEKQIAELVAKRDQLKKQQAALEFAQKELKEAATTESAKKQMSPAQPPPSESKKTKKQKN